MIDDPSSQPMSDEQFDSLAREAGASLRRPAPAGGPDRVRSIRRRRQVARAVAGTGAVAVLVGVGATFLLRDDPNPSISVQPEVTDPPVTAVTVPPATAPNTDATAPAPTTAAPTTPPSPATTAPPQTALGDDAEAWVAGEVANGYTQVDIHDGDGTTARLLVATNTTDAAFEAHAAVLMDDGTVHPVPAELGIAMPTDLYGVGGAPALVRFGDGTAGSVTQVWMIASDTGEWTSTGDLGIAATATSVWGGYAVRVVDDLLIVVNNPYDESDQYTLTLSPERRGVVVHPDLSVTPMAPAPDGVALSFTSSSGGKALQMYGPAVEGGISVAVSYDQPWQYDPVANQWSEIPIPEWMDCGRIDVALSCDWVVVPDIGSTLLEVPTSRGLVALVPDGTIGLYDARASRWTRLDDAPIELTMPTTVVVGDEVVVAPWRTGVDDFTTVAVLDIASGTWTAQTLSIPPDIEARMDSEWFDVSWDLRLVGSRVMAVPGPSFRQSDEDPIAVYDAAIGEWGEPTADDLAAWALLTTRLAG